ncbi:YopX family protein [Mycolicibacterium fortuitum]|uniref:YopX family protein n=1 Tax=Paenibacillus sp. FSL W8-1287 TaxID=2954653 RepID=UPI001CE1DA08|nr:hypothetical protein [Mycolicibacterium fortuitum]
MRAFYKPLKQMLEPDQIESINFDTKVLGVYMEMDGKGYHRLRMSDFVIMWGIGLPDRNGKEIYDGDILTSEHYPFQDEGKYNYHGVIEWIDEEASFYMTKRLANKEKRGISDGISQPIESIEEFEVIGNIYDNPDLLESGR